MISAKHHRFVDAALLLFLPLVISRCSYAPDAEEYTPRSVQIPGIPGGIRQVHNFYISGQPAPEGLGALRARGVRTVINLRTPEEPSGFDEAKAVQGLGMDYVSIPVTPEALNEAVIDRFVSAVTVSKRQTLIHCSDGERASALWAAYLGVNYGLPPERALALAEESGLESEPMKAFVRDYLERRHGHSEL